MDRPSNPEKPFSIHPDTLTMKEKARQEGAETVWERTQAQLEGISS